MRHEKQNAVKVRRKIFPWTVRLRGGKAKETTKELFNSLEMFNGLDDVPILGVIPVIILVVLLVIAAPIFIVFIVEAVVAFVVLCALILLRVVRKEPWLIEARTKSGETRGMWLAETWSGAGAWARHIQNEYDQGRDFMNVGGVLRGQPPKETPT